MPHQNLSVGEKIKSLRLEKGESIENLSRLTGITRSSLEKMENGEMSPPLASLSAWRKFCRFPLVHFSVNAAIPPSALSGATTGQLSHDSAPLILMRGLACRKKTGKWSLFWSLSTQLKRIKLKLTSISVKNSFLFWRVRLKSACWTTEIPLTKGTQYITIPTYRI